MPLAATDAGSSVDDSGTDSGGSDAGVDSGDAGADAAGDASASDAGSCEGGLLWCQGACVNGNISAANCGACGAPCPPGNVCTDGTCSAPTSSWQMFGSDAQHTGENPVETGTPATTDSWSSVVTTLGYLNPVVVENGRVFATFETFIDNVNQHMVLTALDVSDGTQLWTFDFGTVYSQGHPSVVGGTVYVATDQEPTPNPYLWALDATNGQARWASLITNQWDHYWAPLVVGSSVYIDGGEYGGMYGFDTSNGSQLFFNGTLGQYDQWSTAYFGGALYTFIGATFASESPTTGQVMTSLSVPSSPVNMGMRTAPVFGPTYAYLIGGNSIYAIDPVKNAQVWSVSGTYSGTPAVADGVVYALNAGNLVAFDANTGAVLGTMVGDTNLSNPPVVAAGYVYASSAYNVYAWDTATRNLVWTAPAGGWLSIAERRLLVAGGDGVLRAFVLSK